MAGDENLGGMGDYFPGDDNGSSSHACEVSVFAHSRDAQATTTITLPLRLSSWRTTRTTFRTLTTKTPTTSSPQRRGSCSVSDRRTSTTPSERSASTSRSSRTASGRSWRRSRFPSRRCVLSPRPCFAFTAHSMSCSTVPRRSSLRAREGQARIPRPRHHRPSQDVPQRQDGGDQHELLLHLPPPSGERAGVAHPDAAGRWGSGRRWAAGADVGGKVGAATRVQGDRCLIARWRGHCYTMHFRETFAREGGNGMQKPRFRLMLLGLLALLPLLLLRLCVLLLAIL